MKKSILCGLAITSAACSLQAAGIAIPKDNAIEEKVERTLSKMTLDEKIGQMTELSIDVLGDWKDGEFFLDPVKLHEAIAVYKVGSVLNAWWTYCADTTEVGDNNRSYSGSVDERNRHPLHLWS